MQVRTKFEEANPDAFDAGRNVDGSELGAAHETNISYALHAVGYCDGFQF